MNTCIIGCGAISYVHVDSVLKTGGRIVALADIDVEKATILKDKFHLDCAIYTDYRQMLDSEDIDVVHICTPHYLHAEMTIYSLDNGYDVLVEKPLCTKLDDIERILDAERRASGKLAVCLQNRYNPSNVKVKQLLDGKEVIAGVGMVAWNRGFKYYEGNEWKGKWATEGGGALINQALHTLDLLQWYMGEPTSVTAHYATDMLKGIIEVEDTLMATYEYDSGANLNFYCTNCATSMFPVQIMLATNDSKIVLHPDHVIVDGEYISTVEQNASVGKQCWGGGHYILIKDFYEKLRDDKPFWINGVEGAKVMRMILSAYASNGNKILLEENL